MLSSVGLPGLNGFVGEYLTLMGAFRSPVLNSWAYAIFSSTGVILAAVYLLWMYQRFMLGQVVHEENRHVADLTGREIASLVPLVILMVWIGIQPMTFLQASEKNISRTSTILLARKTGVNPFQVVNPQLEVR